MAEIIAPLRPPKRLLMGPGPSPVAARVYQALGASLVGHLDPYFFEVVEDVRRLLKPVFGTAGGYTIVTSGTGTSGMEAAVANFTEPGAKFVVFAAGYFGDRIAEMARRYGATVARCEKHWGEAFTAEEARAFIQREEPRVVAYVQAETSTGVFQDGKAICTAAREAGALVIADCVTSLGGMPVRFDETGIDVAYSCTQKGLSCPPGLSPMALSARALEALKSRKWTPRSFYLDLALLEQYYDGAKYHHTASATLFYALREGLAAIHEEGLEKRWDRHHRNHLRLVEGLENMGLKMLVPEGHRLWTLNTPRVPDGVDEPRIRKTLLEKHGIEIAGGFGPLAGKILRIGSMGEGANEEPVCAVLAALRDALGR
jgi:alanine-glyoxylate transaminase/serine-glyoxylate transaminase/serine-pyruvate transaminase